MNLKTFSIIALFFVVTGCYTNNKNETIQSKIKNPLKLVEYSNVSHITYNPKENNIDISSNTDLTFVKTLLSSLDSSLAEYCYDISICDEVIVTGSNDTLDITVYDFNGYNDEMKKIFKDTVVIDKFIGMYESPVSCRFIFFDKNVCSICNRGITIDKRIDNKLLIDYIEKGTQQRLKRQ